MGNTTLDDLKKLITDLADDVTSIKPDQYPASTSSSTRCSLTS
jgi:hypothetical protein